jgi:hypothetical protein
MRPQWGLARSVFSVSMETCDWFCIGAFGRNLASVTRKMFSHLICFIKKFYKFCNFNAIFRECSNKLYYYSTQETFISVNSDRAHYASAHHNGSYIFSNSEGVNKLSYVHAYTHVFTLSHTYEEAMITTVLSK